MQKDSVIGTLVVAAVVCIVCSLMVSGAAVSLKDKQRANKALDIRKNLLLASGLLDEDEATEENINRLFEEIQVDIIDMNTGQPVEKFDPLTFDQRKAAKDPQLNRQIPQDKDDAGIKRRSQYAKVYRVMNGDQVDMFIFPVHGKGLWSTMYGFFALSSDLETVRGIGFYEHAETPGLGGEIDNPRWKASWKGKKLYDEDFEVSLRVIKGSVSSEDPQSQYKIDGLSGATITANGVSGMMEYWFGPDGFKPFIENVKNNALETTT